MSGKWLGALGCGAAAALLAACASAQSPGSWPAKTVRWVVPYAPGGPTDVLKEAGVKPE